MASYSLWECLCIHRAFRSLTDIKYPATRHQKGAGGGPTRDSDKKPLRSVLRNDIVRSRQTGVHKIVPRPQNISFRSRGSAIQQHCTDPEKTRKSNPKCSRSAPKWHLSGAISASLDAIKSRCLQDWPWRVLRSARNRCYLHGKEVGLRSPWSQVSGYGDICRYI